MQKVGHFFRLFKKRLTMTQEEPSIYPVKNADDDFTEKQMEHRFQPNPTELDLNREWRHMVVSSHRNSLNQVQNLGAGEDVGRTRAMR